MGVQVDSGSAPSVFPLTPQCEVLFELFDGNLGALQLGRLLKGPDAGRLVAMRTLAQQPSAELATAVDLARSIVHPSLAKLLGQVRCGNTWFVASEYISGVTLAELGRAVTNRRSPLDFAVAARIVLSALTAANAAQRLLAKTANVHDARCIYPESIWIADFGEVFVSELLVAQLLAEGPADARRGHGSSDTSAAADAHAAIVELLRLVCEEPATSDQALPNASDLPPELSRILLDAGSHDGTKAYATVAELMAALSALGAGLLATDQQVSQELRLVMGAVIDRRRQKLEMLERFSVQPKEDDATRVFRVALTADEFEATPAPGDSGGRAASLGVPTSRPGERLRSEGAEERTKVFGSIAPHNAATNAQALNIEVAAPMVESATNPISAVWRQAQALLDSPGRRAAQRGLAAPATTKPQAVSVERPSTTLDLGAVSGPAVIARSNGGRAVLMLLLTLLAAAAVRSLWKPPVVPAASWATPSASPSAAR